MTVVLSAPPPAPARAAVEAAYLADERSCLEKLLTLARQDVALRGRVAARAERLVAAVRERRLAPGGLDAFLQEYDLSSQEGVVLMCLAEALLRIPDGATADRLIRDKLSAAHWRDHLGHSRSWLVNASTWGLMLTGRMVELDRGSVADLGDALARLAARSGEPVIRLALRRAMRILGEQFVMGPTIEAALARAAAAHRFRYSFDMLGEAALGRDDAARYLAAYRHAIAAVAAAGGAGAQAEISVKLSALHPRFEYAQRARVLAELVPRLEQLAQAAQAAGIGLTVDAEEAERLELTLDVVEAVFRAPGRAGWQGFGVAVQAYQKRALPVIDWLAELARGAGRRIAVRLVKGAYWDSEIKRAQERGLAGYPVFTRKAATDVSYLACARRLFDDPGCFVPRFATHNAHTAATVLELSAGRAFEFQRLHGMGEALYEEIGAAAPCRVYAPVGGYADLLPYLVRRLLENGANTSFVNRIADERIPIAAVVADPAAALDAAPAPHPAVPLPEALYGTERRNSLGLNLDDPSTLRALAAEMGGALARTWRAAPLVAGRSLAGTARAVYDPADRRRAVGEVVEADAAAVESAFAAAERAHTRWDATPAGERAACLERAAELFERERAVLMALCVREGGRTLPDALAEVREAVDYCCYYAAAARCEFAAPRVLAGPAGERNELALAGRGVFVGISPWNFPLAIFTGQIAAALAAGNAVIAKPAAQTPLVAAAAVRLLHEAGIPPEALHFLPGAGAAVGARLVGDPRCAGVAFTGSTETARTIHRALAARSGAIVPLIAETGGQNCMIVDSSALPEQVVRDVVQSAFDSAGQRCSALRVLFVQEEIAPRVLAGLEGAMAELRIGDPALLETDVGPLIDAAAVRTLDEHIQRMGREGRRLCAARMPEGLEHGNFLAPHAFEIDGPARLAREVFGPVLHVVRYAGQHLDAVIDAVNGMGYGLTLGVHSRIAETAEHIRRRARVGNLYVNRNMIGAVVGVQPFGGEGLSGTGPKAGGPQYLQRFATERTYTVNTAAVGGDAALLALRAD